MEKNEQITAEYDAIIASHHRSGNWVSLVEYEKRVLLDLENRIANNPVEHKQEVLLLVQVHRDLAIAYMALGRPRKAAASAERSVKAAAKIGCRPVDTHFGYMLLARCRRECGDNAAARTAIIRSLTCLLSKGEAEFVAAAIDELGAAPVRALDGESALHLLASDIRLQRRRVYPDRESEGRMELRGTSPDCS